jgi:hypothetical protein
VNISSWWTAADSALIPSSAKSVFWSNTQWNGGAASVGSISSSFEAFDVLIAILGTEPDFQTLRVSQSQASVQVTLKLYYIEADITDFNILYQNIFHFLPVMHASIKTLSINTL